MDDAVTYRLSEMFQNPVGDPSVELVVTSLNVNEGHNKDLMEACQALNGYSIFVSKVRKYTKEAVENYNANHSTPLALLADKNTIIKALVESAVTIAIDECINENILSDFFRENRKEVSEMSVHEYSYEKHLQYEKDESYHDGYDTGHYNGVQNTTALFSWLRANGRQSDIFLALDNPDYLKELFDEYNNHQKH